VLIVDNRVPFAERLRSILSGRHEVTVVDDAQTAIARASDQAYELIIISLDMEKVDALRLCSQLKSLERTRQTPILIIVDPEDHGRLLKALDMGVNDYLMRPIDKQELLARVNTQLRRWRYTEQLRSNVQATIEAAVTDALTGLFNRRYMESQLAAHVDQATHRGRTLAVLALDIDFFKSVNDTHGHDTGDQVLKELAQRLKRNVRNLDVVCRTGGEEFIIILPETDRDAAQSIAERIRRSVSAKHFCMGSKSGPLGLTISIGVANLDGTHDSMDELLKRADQALYRAKREGRNRVISAAA
jgi:two-component system, cell cycle response regulator